MRFCTTILIPILLISSPVQAQCDAWLTGPLIDQPEGFDSNAGASASVVWTPPNGPPLLVVGGIMTSAGGVPVHNLAAWDGASWRDLGGGVSATPGAPIVTGLAVFNNDLVVCGRISSA